MKLYIITLLSLLFITTDAFAQRQRINYTSLQARAKQPNLYLDTIITPGKDTTESVFTVIFRFDNDFLPFKKINPTDDISAPGDEEYYATIRLNAEIFNGKYERDPNNLQSVNRDFWSDTVFTKTFEDTQSKKKYVAGQLSTTLKNGEYNYLLQLGLGESVNDRNSSRRNIRIMNNENKMRGDVYLIKSISEAENPILTLTNMSQSVEFGKDFLALILIPNYDSDAKYSIQMNRVNPGRKDTTLQAEVFAYELGEDDIYNNSTIALTDLNDNPALELIKSGGSYTYALVKIPNSTFENAAYRLALMKEGMDRPLAFEIVRSFWSDMPASLFSLDISLEMLKYITTADELKELKRGNGREKEMKFRDFWKDKDPTPSTVYNELMAEYYRRIDYSFEEFSGPQTPGFETDQGETYIKFGPPDEITRRRPGTGEVLELWRYGKRTFVFEKTSGFGEFQLISRG